MEIAKKDMLVVNLLVEMNGEKDSCI